MAAITAPAFNGLPVILEDKNPNSLSFKFESIKFHLLYQSLRKKLRALCDFFDDELRLPGGKQLLEDMELERARANTLEERMFGLVTVVSSRNPVDVLKVLKSNCTELEKVYITKKSENSSFTIMAYSSVRELRKKLQDAFQGKGILAIVRIKPSKNADLKNL